jgi:hypothetical protein
LGFAPDVRDTPTLAFFDYIFRNQSIYDKAWAKRKKELKHSSPMFQDEIATHFALQDLILDWNVLRTLKGACWLREEITEWADRWHLNNDWCLDFALECVKDIKTSFIDKMRLPENFLSQGGFMSKWEYSRFWSYGRAWSGSLFNYGNSRFKDFYATSEIKNYPAALNFTWQKEGYNGPEDVSQ